MEGAICQSCGRRIDRPEDFGTDARRHPITRYCSACHVGGRFVEPNLSLSDAISRASATYERRDGMAPGLARARALQSVPLLGRWAAADLLQRGWWALLIRGLLAILFGVLVLVYPGPSAAAILLLFGAWVFVDGIFALGHAFGGGSNAWLFAVEGIFGIAIGVMAFARPAVTAMALYATVATWAIIIGILRIVNGLRLRGLVQGTGWLIAAGLCAIGFGVLLFALPRAGALALLWMIGLLGIVFGILLVALSGQVRSLHKRLETTIGPPRGTEPQPA
jgi:uncharacterized membrane protein HdeD (DUF308 family)